MSHTDLATKMKVAAIFLLALAGCSNSGGTGGGREQYTIQINAFGANLGTGAAALTVTEATSGATVTFSGNAASQTLNHQFGSGDTYNLAIKDPTDPAQKCLVTSGSPSGTVSGDVTVGITCSIVLVNVSGSVSGLKGTSLVLQFTNGTPATQAIAPTSSGTFTFTVHSGSTWAVAAVSQPTGPTQSCVGQSSAGPVGTTPVTGVQVTCTTAAFTVSGTVTNLIGTSGMVLTDGVGGSLPFSPSSLNEPQPFTFGVPSGATYTLAATNPTNPVQTCAPLAGSATGTIGNANVANIVVNCTTATYPINFTLLGSSQLGVQATLVVNGSPFSSLLVSCNSDTACNGNSAPSAAQYRFPNAPPSGSSYRVVVSAQNDSSQNCFVWNVGGSGTLGGASPPAATIQCKAVPTYAFGVGSDTSGSSPANAAALFTLDDPLATLGFLSNFTSDPIDLTLDNPVQFAVAGGALQDFIVQNTGLGTVISSYFFNQPPNVPPNFNSGEPTVTIAGSVDAIVFDQSNDTLLVCYNDLSGAYYFQAYNLSLGPIQSAPASLQLTTSGGGCSLFLATNAAASQPNSFVYAFYLDNNTGNYSLQGFNLGPSTLIPQVITPIGTLGAPVTVAPSTDVPSLPSVDPLGRFLYIANNVCTATVGVHASCTTYQTSANGYAINPTSGALTTIAPTVILSASSSPASNPLLYEPSGTFAYLTNSSAVIPLSISASGSLSGANLQTTSIGQDEISTASIDPSGTFLIVSSVSGNFATSKVLTYTINPVNGSLSELPPISLAAFYLGTPIIDPSGEYVYVGANQFSMSTGYTSSFYSYVLNSTTGLQSIPPPANYSPILNYETFSFSPGNFGVSTTLILQGP